MRGEEVETDEAVALYIRSLMPENLCCGAFRMALQNLILTLAGDGWYYIQSRYGGNQFIACCPWCGRQLVTDEEKERAFKETA